MSQFTTGENLQAGTGRGIQLEPSSLLRWGDGLGAWGGLGLMFTGKGCREKELHREFGRSGVGPLQALS